MSAPTRRIFIIGPSSTGKTTLCTALAEKLNIPPSTRISEVARTVMKKTHYSRDTIGQLDMQMAIMEAQLQEETAVMARLAESGGGTLLSDRSAVDAVVYAMLTSTTKEEREARWATLVEGPALEQALQYYRESTVVLLLPVKEWLVDDGVRSMYDQVHCAEEFAVCLAALEMPYYTLGSECREVGARVERVISWLVESS